MADPLVSEWHCRDLDSRISERELAAVKNWQISNKTYHIMRDNRCVSNQTKTILISIKRLWIFVFNLLSFRFWLGYCTFFLKTLTELLRFATYDFFKYHLINGDKLGVFILGNKRCAFYWSINLIAFCITCFLQHLQVIQW